jgi:serine/threonine protein kinase
MTFQGNIRIDLVAASSLIVVLALVLLLQVFGHDNIHHDLIVCAGDIIEDEADASPHKYEVVNLLGTGSFAQVLLAVAHHQDDDVEKTVALKVVQAVPQSTRQSQVFNMCTLGGAWRRLSLEGEALLAVLCQA